VTTPLEPGRVLAGKYRVERQLGEGGMGVVIAATDIQLERRVAVKFLLPEYSAHEEAAKRFLREARAAVRIQSEHVARVIDVGTLETGAPYMVMEYLEGSDLSAVIEERGPLPVGEAVGHVLEACDAIAEAHSYGIVHRDLKPANLFLARQPDGSSRIKVLDFGISKAMMGSGSGIDHSLTRTSSLMGSPLYMSPEQMKSAKNVDPRTDIWALGVILYELLSGAPPFAAESIPELSAKILLEETAPMGAVRSDVPPELEAVMRKALAKVPERRRPEVQQLISLINEQLWVGHFDLWIKDGMVMFRHALVLAGGLEPTNHQCQSLLSTALEACEGYFPAFQFVVWAGKQARPALDAAMFETSGEA
jgi:serine/threonine-protein kinase